MPKAADLLSAIEAADPSLCAGIVSDLDERARRELYPAIADRVKELDAELRDFSSSSRKDRFDRYGAARIALLGLASLGELKKMSSWPFRNGELAAEVLARRNPGWLGDWAEFELPRSPAMWATVRALVRRGAIARPATEFYILGMIAAPNRHNPPRGFLERDPTLLDVELWSLFEHEGSGELSLAAYDKYVQEANSWLAAFATMAADGTIDRARVLKCTLDALQRDFAPFRAGWFSRLHETLKPSGIERAALCEQYLDLLSSRVPATVSFAMKALVQAHKAGGLDLDKTLDRLAPAFEARDKGTVERALALAAKVSSKGNRAVKARVAALAAPALGHESADIQTLALALMNGDSSLIAPYLEVLAPSVRAGLKGPEPDAVEARQSATLVVVHSQVEPIVNVEALVQTFAAVLENQGPPIEIERVIDGIARIGIAATQHAGFERLTAALAKRAEKLQARGRKEQPAGALAGLALAWSKGIRIAAPKAEANPADFLIWRLWCVAEQTAQRIEQPLLALPTSPDGSLDPGEFQTRLAGLTDAQRKAAVNDTSSIFHLDFLLAELRAMGCATPPKLRISWRKQSWEAQGHQYHHYQPSIETEGPLPPPSRLHPASLTMARFDGSVEMKRWCATISPRWREGWFAAGCRDIGGNLEWWQADWPARAYLEPLVNPATPLEKMGALLIAIALGAKEGGESGLATDALIAGVSDARLDAGLLGQALIEAARSGAIKFSRWAKQLQKAAQTGSPQANVAFLAIEALLESGVGAEAADFGRLVELEQELAHLTGLRVTRPAALATLRGVKTGGKTARAASELLKLSSQMG